MDINNDIDNNINNTNYDQIINIDNLQEILQNDEKYTEKCSHEHAINEDINNSPICPQKKSINYNILKDNITTLKADMITVKNFMMQEIFNITKLYR